MTSPPHHSPTEDPYSRCDYRRLIAWPERIEREAPFLRRVFAGAQPSRLLDLGCGTGEHSRFLTAEGFEVVGVDRSPAMLEKAGDQPLPPGLHFVEADLADLGEAVDGTFGGALSLGNTLPHLNDVAMARLLNGLRQRLAPGASFLFQIINYDRVFATGQRALPVSVRPTPGTDEAAGEEIVFLRLMTPLADGRVIFSPTTLRYRPGSEPAVEVERSRNVELRGWRRAEMEELLSESGFTRLTAYGGMRGEPWEETASSDLVMVAKSG